MNGPVPVKQDPLRDACEAMWELLPGRPPRVPRIAAEFGLTPPQLHLLRLLGEGETLPMRALAELLCCDASYVTAIVDRLEQRGLIERRPDSRDRRVKLIVLTKPGETLRRQALEELFEPPDAMKKLPVADQKALRDILRKAIELQ